MARTILLGLVLIAHTVLADEDVWQTYHSADLSHQTVARTLTIKGDQVKLLKRDGQMVNVPLDRLDPQSRLNAFATLDQTLKSSQPSKLGSLEPEEKLTSIVKDSGWKSGFNPGVEAAKERRRYRRQEALAMRRQLYGGGNHVFTISSPPINYGFIPTIRNPPPLVYRGITSNCGISRRALLASHYAY